MVEWHRLSGSELGRGSAQRRFQSNKTSREIGSVSVTSIDQQGCYGTSSSSATSDTTASTSPSQARYPACPASPGATEASPTSPFIPDGTSDSARTGRARSSL